MNFFSKYSNVPGAAAKPPRRPRLVAVWVIDSRTGKPKRVWRLALDREGSSRRRPGGPLQRLAA
jgi:hypothetical protein